MAGRKSYVYESEGEELYCALCGVPLRSRRIELSYLGHTFGVEVPCCPECGQKYIPRSLAQGKMAEVETLLEDK